MFTKKWDVSFFHDPWLVRDEYIQVILDRSADKVEQFLSRHQNHSLSPSEQIDALRLLEMQRHTLLMYTSCGWFFEELSRPEGTQILRYAARALELAGEVAGVHLEEEFIAHLRVAPSNVLLFKDGAEVYRQLVISAQISFKQVAAHYAISSLFTNYPEQQRLYCYEAHQLDYQKQYMGSLTLAVGQVRLVSQITWEEHHFVFAVLHLGGWDFHCCIQPFSGRLAYTQLRDRLFDTLQQASAAQTILAMSEWFSDRSFSLQHLFAEERYRIMQQLTINTKKHLDQLYTQVYRDNYSILAAFHRDELPVPVELQVAAEIALSHRCLGVVTALEQSTGDPQAMTTHLSELEAIATESDRLHCQLEMPEARTTLENLILRFLWQLLYENDPTTLEADIQRLIQIIKVGKQLHLGISLARAQELYYHYLYERLVPDCLESNGSTSCRWTSSQLCPLLGLGQELAVDVNPWLALFE